ncbi:hypothetical protein [Acrocarpospora sp. B8E8]|uniref:hypothetical protein n=1 Tax=Acrocarpospora sp. B8E8 TaxID=3153572 RepID=UPI00325E7450
MTISRTVSRSLHSGWTLTGDWGPTLVTAGIWRPIGLESWSGPRLAEVRPLVTTHRADG